MITDAWALAITKICELFILVIQDMPPAERRESWHRWFKFWRPVWKSVGLDVTEDPIPPAEAAPPAAVAATVATATGSK